MDSSALQYHVETMSHEEQTVECPEFSAINELA